MMTHGQESTVKKVYRNGNVAWSTSTDIQFPVSKKQNNNSHEKLTSKRKAGNFQDIVYQIGGNLGIFQEKQSVGSGQNPPHIIVSEQCESTMPSGKNKDGKSVRFLKCTNHLEWTKVSDLLMTFFIVTTCGSIVAYQTYYSISK